MELGETTAIADVTQLLTSLLSGLDVTHDSPAELQGAAESFAKINLYLYEVEESTHVKNQTWKASATSPDMMEYPPLALNLFYLLTPYASDSQSAHSVLGHAMRLFHDNSIIEGDDLPPSLKLNADYLSVSLRPTKLEDLTRIWNALHTPYRLSVAYEVKVLKLQSAIQQPISRVKETKNVFYRI